MIIQVTSLIFSSEKNQVPHYLFFFFLRNKEVLDFFLEKGNTFFNRSIVDVAVVAPKRITDNDARITARSLRA
jgi:hypothetical protein